MLIEDQNDLQPVDVAAQITVLAKRYKTAGGVGMQVLNLIGGQAEGLLDRLPDAVRVRLDEATRGALQVALKAAGGSRQHISDQPAWLNTAAATAMGAAGGFGGLPAAMAELPVTVTVLLRAIQSVAVEYGFDPDEDNVAFDCLEVFASAGPLAKDDGSDLAFLATRTALTGTAVNAVLARIAPRLAAVMGQKLAAQTVPVLGAVAGAATNYAYTSYYQEMAHVHFGLRRLAIEGDVPHDELVAQLADAMKRLPRR